MKHLLDHTDKTRAGLPSKHYKSIPFGWEEHIERCEALKKRHEKILINTSPGFMAKVGKKELRK